MPPITLKPRNERVTFDQLVGELERVLSRNGFTRDESATMARVFAESTRDGVHSHGVNRFPLFIQHVRKGIVKTGVAPELVHAVGAFERWDGHGGAGILNALHSMGRAIALAEKHGVGCVGLRHTNHWMRAGTYGLQAADAGCIGICWTNTIALMPPWGGQQVRVGNNPVVIAAPRQGGHLLLDMAMSQFSVGRIESAARSGEPLPADAGFDSSNHVTRDPAAVLKTKRLLPIGLWKGVGLRILLDTLAAAVSEGHATHHITAGSAETSLSQIFIAIDLKRIAAEKANVIVESIVADVNSATPSAPGAEVPSVPGQRMAERRARAERDGIAVRADIWREIQAL
ncbi:MAG TPA: 3-dehydro-L-gulonate 2-dehydrogenase [Terriglobales bacterium]|nr:3-dehydro-L-gulonate 2-dehydrogenase [Terriglobales bacterium]